MDKVDCDVAINNDSAIIGEQLSRNDLSMSQAADVGSRSKRRTLCMAAFTTVSEHDDFDSIP